MKTLLSFSSLHHFIELNTPIELQCWFEDGVYFVHSPLLDFTVFEPSEEEAIRAMCESIEADWFSYALEDDAQLDTQAIVLKNTLLSIVKSVTPLALHAAA